jgi:hypothetical protein
MVIAVALPREYPSGETNEEKTMNVDFRRAVIGGLVGTAVMTIVGLFAAPMMGLPPMNPADMLAGAMGGNLLLGWGGHIMIGVVLALGYAVVGSRLAGTWHRPRRDILHRTLPDGTTPSDADDGDAALLRLRVDGDGKLGWPHHVRSHTRRDLRRGACDASGDWLTP